jgi:tetratricopeptide (TPR) repeat protein
VRAPFLAPATARTETDDGIRFADIPTPSPLPAAAKSGATFSEPQRTGAAGPGAPSASRPAMPRALTPNEAELARGFPDQHTPTGAGFGAGPGEHRTPTEPGAGPESSRVSTDNAVAAEAAFKRGELAMKRDQPREAILEFKTACDLDPTDADYSGVLAWARFCAAGDKPAVAGETRKLLERAASRSKRPERAGFLLGRVERMLGRDKEALRHFQEVLALKPNHAEAASEVRAIEARQAAAKGGGGLFGRKR